MEMITHVLVGAVIVEAIIEYFGAIFNKNFNPKCLLSIVFGSIFAVVYQIDMLAMVGFETGMPFIGMVLTGILLSRGSNYIADLFKKVGDKK